ncbi:hypothetical protein FHR81_001770 [Actinoalloteichus hoggarensis]|uniref:Uncharacterized protein n=1 Tax=Actinoalloteichus hoggarensis TaxID=1470176 RepID=A0A221W505_9PSEU|nr:hypothetical protein [Actinoalloteichus hoggarensis]ASO20803.1 hypothetical protein AHOG_15885 [Actinoalloteichus hoggarensis]MBB5920732.1 hypothetical protein [Actinoalloteichus hoggarensis]
MARDIAVVLLVGWQEDPFYYETKQSETYNHSLDEAEEDLLLPADLVADIAAWDDEFQAVYRPDDYRNSEFESPETEAAWYERGRVLAERVKRQSPVVVSVEYRADGAIRAGECVF